MSATSWTGRLNGVLGRLTPTPRRTARRRSEYRPRLEQLEERRLLYAGALDPTFGFHGISLIDLGFTVVQPTRNTFGNANAIDANGKIVIAGTAELTQSRVSSMFVARMNTDGSPDTTFNGTGFEVLSSPPLTQLPSLRAVAIDAQGEIVVAGSFYETNNNLLEIVVARLNPDGSLDPSFGTNGMVLYSDNNGGALSADSMVIQSDGKIVLGGGDNYNFSPGGNVPTYFALVRLNHDGSVDSSFSSSNVVSHPGQPGLVLTNLANPTSNFDYVSSLATAPDGTIAAAGEADLAGTPAVVLYNSDGTLDGNFGGNGIWVGSSTAGIFMLSGIAFQPDGKIVTSGSDWGITSYDAVRFLPNGDLDPSFGTGGTATATLPISGIATAMVLQPDGKIVVAGGSGGSDFALGRLNADGSVDKTFNFSGLVTTDIGGSGTPDSLDALALQPDGKIVAVGDTVDLLGYNAIAVARYLGDPGGFQPINPNSFGQAIRFGESSGAAPVVVQRLDGATGTVTVDYATSDGTATAGADYTPVSGTLTFLDGQTIQTINIPLLDDGTLEGGSETINVTLSNPTGGATLGTQTTTQVTILDPDLLTNSATATEGIPFTRVLARFAGSNPTVAIGDYAASINWGGTATAPDITPGVLSPDPRGGFDVTGTNTYAEEGTYAVTVTMTGGDNISGGTTITIGDAPLTATAVNLNVIGSKNFSGPVATFKDADPAGVASDYIATITWDDGTTSVGTISGTGPFTVSGSHLFSPLCAPCRGGP
jgi:uncharacterized delta-60 repeat protein